VLRGTPLAPFVLGAGHEAGIRPGTENVASIVALGVACDRARLDMETEGVRVRALRDRLWDLLRELVPGLGLNGHPQDRLPHTLSVRFPGVSANALLSAAPGIAASAGSACHAGHEEPPSTIVLMGVPPREAHGTVRLSLGRGTSRDHVERAAAALADAWQQMTRS